ncbi:MAG: cytochrome ubiquinol oxidase subunit I [Deltaproteobacteria bacterium]|nr:cytochrome ubiquinol oxidase subunit I [Deltaproteobacteria bacterium]
MDAVLLSRVQFAVTTYFHFLFVPLTLGLSLIIAIIETLYVKTGDEDYLAMARFWGRLFVVNFVIGVVTGLPLEFQFGTNWSRYSAYVGDVFGPLLAIEVTAAFFLESTFLAVWVFGWKRLSAGAHAAVMWIITGASTLSALWILIANSWMQHPVGYAIRGGRAEITDFLGVVTQEYAVLTVLHTVGAAYLLSGFVMMGISAYHILKGRDLFVKSFKPALYLSLVCALFVMAEGHMHGADLAEKQPAKLAALEALWETQTYAPLYLVAVPRMDNRGNLIELVPIPGVMSLLAHHNPAAEVTGLLDLPADELPPVAVVFYSFRIMVTLGGLFVLLTLYGWLRRNRLNQSPRFLKILIWSIPLPYIVCAAGWTVTEMGRQPWIVYGLMKTADAASPVAPHQITFSLVAFIVIYSLVALAALVTMIRYARRWPDSPEKERRG